MSVLEKTQQKIKNCSKCHGELSYFNESGKLVRCCHRDNLFLRYFKRAEIAEEFIVQKFVSDSKEWLSKHDLFCVCAMSYDLRMQIKHSAGYMATKCGEYTRIYNDANIIDTVFNRAGVEEGSSILERFFEPAFLILELGITTNKDYIETYILSILEKRLADGNKTLILIPSTSSLTMKYNSESLETYLTKTLKDKGAFINVLK